MIDNRQVAIDLSAEQQVFSPSLANASEDLNVVLTAQNSLQLPESILFEPTKVNISEQTQAEVSKTLVDLDVKFDAEENFKNLKSTVADVQKTLTDTVDSISSRWIPNPKPASDFEERPSLEQTNLIFDERKDRFSRYPDWA